ncbi:MAG TPA: alkaline phosphatase family protein [Bryobacteraceae bacterium]|nr:alkaline phosphatase family protein [Bryobacteraceae bacterium]
MRRFLPVLLGAALAVSLPAAEPNRERMVVVISLDGFPSYALEDPRLPIPTIRRLAREGAAAVSSRPINPTVTWPNHTAMVTGTDASRHQVLYNGLLVRPSADKPGKIEPWRPKDEMVRQPTLYDLAVKAGLSTAQVDWVAIYGAPNITWKFAEIPDPDGTIEKELIGRGVATREQLATFGESSQAWRDRIWTQAAAHILVEHKPNLMLFHLLNMDSTHHRYAPMSAASYTAFAFADDRVKELYDALDKAGLLPRTTFLIVSDHGFHRVKHLIHAEPALAAAGIKGAWVVPEGGTEMIYVSDPAQRAALLPRLRETLRNVEGVEDVFGEEAFDKLGLPRASEPSPDLVLSAKPGYAFSGGSKGPVITDVAEAGSHGYLNTNPDMQAIFIAWGAGIRSGARLEQVSTMDVGPTAAALLGLDMGPVQGRVLQEILK